MRPALVIALPRTQLTMKSMADALRRAATTDIVTGMANRRKFEEALAFEWSRLARIGGPICWRATAVRSSWCGCPRRRTPAPRWR